MRMSVMGFTSLNVCLDQSMMKINSLIIWKTWVILIHNVTSENLISLCCFSYTLHVKSIPCQNAEQAAGSELVMSVYMCGHLCEISSVM